MDKIKFENIISTLNIMKKFITVYRIGFIVISMCCAFQLIDLTIIYTNFETVVNIGFARYNTIPSVSLCINSRNNLTKIIEDKLKNETIGNYVLNSVFTYELNAIFSDNIVYDVKRKFKIIESFTPFSINCITFM